DGRWRLRAQGSLLPIDEPPAIPETVTLPQQTLGQGCYVVFDLEAIGQDAHSPATEIIQIAAQRWTDGVKLDTWATFVRPSVPIPANIVELTQISMNEVR